VYAAAGSHERAQDALPGLANGLYDGFNAKLLDLLAHNMALQAKAGAEVIAVMDTAAGEIDAGTYGDKVVPVLADLLARFRRLDPDTPVLYYSAHGARHWDQLSGLPIQALGIDWRHDIARYSRSTAIAGASRAMSIRTGSCCGRRTGTTAARLLHEDEGAAGRAATRLDLRPRPRDPAEDTGSQCAPLPAPAAEYFA